MKALIAKISLFLNQLAWAMILLDEPFPTTGPDPVMRVFEFRGRRVFVLWF